MSDPALAAQANSTSSSSNKRSINSSETANASVNGSSSSTSSTQANPTSNTSNSIEGSSDSKRQRTDETRNGNANRGRGGNRGARGARGRGGGGGGGGGKFDRHSGSAGGRGGNRNSRGQLDTRSFGGRNTGAGSKGMRSWGPKSGDGGSEATEGATTGESRGEGTERLPKKKVAVFFGYNGTGYKGSQINPGENTIEGVLWKAFIDSGCVSADNADDYKKVGLSRAARTDAGVHAAINIITIKLILAPTAKPEGQELEEWINTFLPRVVRVWRIVRVQSSFEPRKACDQRNYEYSLPTYVFLGPKPKTVMAEWLDKIRLEHADTTSAVTEAARSATERFWSSVKPSVEGEAPINPQLPSHDPEQAQDFASDLAAKRQWRITSELLQLAREFVKEYEGTHNYHNFTVASVSIKDQATRPGEGWAKKGGPNDASSMRVMRSLTISDPFVVDGVEYVSVDFIGQSFMLHQIRKMIGLMILAVRSGTPTNLVEASFAPVRIHVPKAPALGLLLVEPQYEEYNRRILEHNAKIQELPKLSAQDKQDQQRERLGVEVGTSRRREVDDFKRVEIQNVMWRTEVNEATFAKWVNYLDVFDGEDFHYLNPSGTIPESAKGKTEGSNNKNWKPRVPIENAETTTTTTTKSPVAADNKGDETTSANLAQATVASHIQDHEDVLSDDERPEGEEGNEE